MVYVFSEKEGMSEFVESISYGVAVITVRSSSQSTATLFPFSHYMLSTKRCARRRSLATKSTGDFSLKLANLLKQQQQYE